MMKSVIHMNKINFAKPSEADSQDVKRLMKSLTNKRKEMIDLCSVQNDLLGQGRAIIKTSMTNEGELVQEHIPVNDIYKGKKHG